MNPDGDLVTRFKNVLQKEHGASVTYKQAKDGLDNASKFFGLLWKYDLADKRKEKEMEVKNYVA